MFFIYFLVFLIFFVILAHTLQFPMSSQNVKHQTPKLDHFEAFSSTFERTSGRGHYFHWQLLETKNLCIKVVSSVIPQKGKLFSHKWSFLHIFASQIWLPRQFSSATEIFLKNFRKIVYGKFCWTLILFLKIVFSVKRTGDLTLFLASRFSTSFFLKTHYMRQFLVVRSNLFGYLLTHW